MRRHLDPERLGCSQVDGQFEFVRRLDRQLCRAGATQNTVDVISRPSELIAKVDTVCDQPTICGEGPERINRWQPVLCCQVDDHPTMRAKNRIRQHDEPAVRLACKRLDGAHDLGSVAHAIGGRLYSKRRSYSVDRSNESRSCTWIAKDGYSGQRRQVSAKELALAVHAIQPDLAPFVLVISNDPDDLLNPVNDSDTAAKARRQAQREEQLKKARASVNRSEPVTDIVTPATTVANARTAHGILGVDQLRSSLRAALPHCDVRMIHVRVWPQQLDETSNRSRAVSMSWWLSKPIQHHLHQQTERGKNQNENGPRLQAVWDVLRTTSGCASARRP